MTSDSALYSSLLVSICVPPNNPITACGATSFPAYHSFPKWAIAHFGKEWYKTLNTMVNCFGTVMIVKFSSFLVAKNNRKLSAEVLCPNSSWPGQGPFPFDSFAYYGLKIIPTSKTSGIIFVRFKTNLLQLFSPVTRLNIVSDVLLRSCCKPVPGCSKPSRRHQRIHRSPVG